MTVEHSDDFTDLVAQVHRRSPTSDPGALVDAAALISAELAADADRLLDHFVNQARDAGISWTDIGARLGISKQAARQRFGDHPVGSLPFTAQIAPRLQICVRQAGDEARADGATEIGTHHLLAGLLAEGVAAAILEHLDVHIEGIRAASHRLFGPPAASSVDGPPPMSAEATCALETAAQNAARIAVDDVGSAAPEVRTEHLLAVLALDPGSRARRVLNDLEVDIAAIKRELQRYIAVSPPRPSRWWKRRPTAAAPCCSFCGRTTSPNDLVNGPGVTICRSCIALAADILATRQPA